MFVSKLEVVLVSGFGFAWNIKEKFLRDLLSFLDYRPLRAMLQSLRPFSL